MDPRVPLEIRRDGLRGDVLAAGEFRHCLLVQLEATEVVGEIQHAFGGQAIHAGAQQAHVFALDVEVVGARRAEPPKAMNSCAGSALRVLFALIANLILGKHDPYTTPT